jgi:protease IV
MSNLPPPGQGPAIPPGSPPPGYPPRGPAPMGPYPPMPPMMMMPPPRSSGGGFAKAIFLTLATTIFGLSLLLNVYLILAAGITNSAQAQTSTAIETPVPSLKQGDPKQKIGIIRFDGAISQQSKRPFVMLLEHLRRDPDLKAIVLEIDSPGGEVTASDELYDAVLRLKKEKNIPVVVSMGSLAASGGYYMAMSGNKILAQETTLTGSIGVLMQRIDLSGFGEKYGIKGEMIVSDGATFKDAGSPFRPLTEPEHTYFKSILNDSFEVFKDRIEKGRPGLTRQQIDAVANGKIYSAKQALELKLIDRIGYLEDAIADAAVLAGLNNPSAVRVERELSFAEKLFGPTVQASGNVTATGLKLDRSTIDEFARPRMMYLWQGQ